MFRKMLLLWAACLALPALAGTGVMIKDEDLRASASTGAATLGRVAKGASVDILARQGGWTQISDQGRTGWVRILAVKSSAPSAGAADVLGLVEAGTTRRDPGKVVAVAGVRGLNEEELKLARFNAEELARLERFASDRADAQTFARNAGLQAAKVAYLPKPKKAASPDSPNEPWNFGQ
jgi:hypothetical protein